ncbi:MAG TPA: DNA (cytosine-5-)-methyltransferase [Rhizomicrobium sp.]|jgi:DNA (cytosine-5)-methyltransferase 1|nr:DNA (cytosine-5-)-methyltransferase [Rhizomicrobium sp.]
MKFVDLFAGLGGFHLALSQLGHECVFASELDPDLAALYEKNFGLKPHGDIRDCHEEVPVHDILCAGFPCQPFSKAGEQLGFDCPQWGDLFEYVVGILKRRKPRFLMIENVPNLLKHDDGKTWKKIAARLRKIGYKIDSSQLSPHLLGVPQIRDRAYIVGARRSLAHFSWPQPTGSLADLSIETVLDRKPSEAKALPPQFIRYIDAWQSLLDELPRDQQLPSFPIWAMEFGATYPFKVRTPSAIGMDNVRAYKGALGQSLKGLSDEQVMAALPAYARDTAKKFQDWKVHFIEQNRTFYRQHKKIIDHWLPSIHGFAPSFQKLEWNWKNGPRDLWHTVIQFRASGIRAKRPTATPSLVALTTSQVPVIPWERRYMVSIGFSAPIGNVW